MSLRVNIHTHHPTGRAIELRTAGIHPWDSATKSIAELLPLDASIQAIGEIGLDFCCTVSRAVQEACFREQLELARSMNLPVMLHCVRAFNEVLAELRQRPPRAVIFHGFTGSPEQAREAWRRGYYLSFGERTFRSPRTLEALRNTPQSQLFFETDESMTPIEEIYRRMAEATGQSEEEWQRIIYQNYQTLFG